MDQTTRNEGDEAPFASAMQSQQAWILAWICLFGWVFWAIAQNVQLYEVASWGMTISMLTSLLQWLTSSSRLAPGTSAAL